MVASALDERRRPRIPEAEGLLHWLGRICPIIDDSYIEGIVELARPESGERVENWLRERGLACIPMRVGCLVTGNRAAFEAAFGVSLLGVSLPFTLPIPQELRGQVASATILPPKRMTGPMTPLSRDGAVTPTADDDASEDRT